MTLNPQPGPSDSVGQGQLASTSIPRVENRTPTVFDNSEVASRYDSGEENRRADGATSYTSMAEKLLSRGCSRSPITACVDLGAGTGLSTAVILNRFPEASVCAIEPGSAMVARIPTKLSAKDVTRVNILHCDALTGLRELRSASMDLVSAHQSMHWFPMFEGTPVAPNTRYLEEVLREVGRILKPGGAFLFSTTGDATDLPADPNAMFLGDHPFYKAFAQKVFDLLWQHEELRAVLKTPEARLAKPCLLVASINQALRDVSMGQLDFKVDFSPSSPEAVRVSCKNAYMALFQKNGFGGVIDKSLATEVIDLAYKSVSEDVELVKTLSTIVSGERIVYARSDKL